MYARFGEALLNNSVDENEANMNGALPVHPAVVRELGLAYGSTIGDDDPYRKIMEQMISEARSKA